MDLSTFSKVEQWLCQFLSKIVYKAQWKRFVPQPENILAIVSDPCFRPLHLER